MSILRLSPRSYVSHNHLTITSELFFCRSHSSPPGRDVFRTFSGIQGWASSHSSITTFLVPSPHSSLSLWRVPLAICSLGLPMYELQTTCKWESIFFLVVVVLVLLRVAPPVTQVAQHEVVIRQLRPPSCIIQILIISLVTRIVILHHQHHHLRRRRLPGGWAHSEVARAWGRGPRSS